MTGREANLSTQTQLQSHVLGGLYVLGALIEQHVDGASDPEDDGIGACSNVGGAYNHEGETFSMRAYCWCDGGAKGHEDDCPPNFQHHASGFAVDWYKHVGRSAYSNRAISPAEWSLMLKECIASIASEGVQNV